MRLLPALLNSMFSFAVVMFPVRSSFLGLVVLGFVHLN